MSFEEVLWGRDANVRSVMDWTNDSNDSWDRLIGLLLKWLPLEPGSISDYNYRFQTKINLVDFQVRVFIFIVMIRKNTQSKLQICIPRLQQYFLIFTKYSFWNHWFNFRPA